MEEDLYNHTFLSVLSVWAEGDAWEGKDGMGW